MELTVTRRDLSYYTIPVAKGELSQKLLSHDVVTLTVESTSPIQFSLGDSIELFGRIYTINRLPKVSKGVPYVYDVEFEGEMYALLRSQYLLYDDTGVAIESDFNYMGSLRDVAGLAVTNLNRVYGVGTYQLGTCPETEVKNHTINGENVLAVLQRACKDYGYEFELVRNQGGVTLNIGTIGNEVPIALRYGAGQGLYQLDRLRVDDKNLCTRLYAYGGTRNLKSSYRNFSRRLKLPGNDQSYIQDTDAINLYGVIEASKVFDDIYPRRTGTITSVAATNSFTDSTMDFDLNATDGQGQSLYIIPGNAPKVRFNTGNLAGYELEIASYNQSTKTFVLKYYKDERGYQYPSSDAAFALAVGDEYVLLDIVMPQTYVDAAENELLAKATELLNASKSPKAKYSCQIDPLYAKQNEMVLCPGDYIHVQDDDFGINRNFRVLELKRNVIEPYRWSIELGDQVDVSIATYLVEQTAEHAKVITNNMLKDPDKYRNSWRTALELQQMVFDQDGYFDSQNIRPLSINTSMLSVGSKAGQFVLNGVVFQTGYNGVANRVVSTAGTLSHYAIGDSIRTWNVASYDYLIPDNDARYIYIRCEVNGNAAVVRYKSDQVKVDDEPGYYNFLVGVIHSIQDGYRKVSLTYGSTFIHGKEVKTGRIASQDGSTYFDLDEGEIRGKIVFRSGKDDAEVESSISNAQIAANNAQSSAESALSQLSNITNDDVLTPNEKTFVRKEWDAILSEKSTLESYAASYGVSTTNYTTKFQNLANYLNNGVTWSSGYPAWINDSQMSQNTSLGPGGGNTMRTKFKEYYDEKVALLNAVTNKINGNVTTIQNSIVNPNLYGYTIKDEVTVSLGSSFAYIPLSTESATDTINRSSFNWVKAGIPSGTKFTASFYVRAGAKDVTIRVNGYKDTDTNYIFIGQGSQRILANQEGWLSVTVTVSNATYPRLVIVLQNWDTNNTTTTTNYIKLVKLEKGELVTAYQPSFIQPIVDMSLDNRLTPDEKQLLKKEWDAIAAEYPKVTLQAAPFYQCNTLKSSYQSAYDTLNTYLNDSNNGILKSLSTTIDVDGPTLRANFTNYYSAKQDLLNKIADEQQWLANNKGNWLKWSRLKYKDYPIDWPSIVDFANSWAGLDVENAIVSAETPFGTYDKVWEGKSTNQAATTDGGFYSREVYIDVNKTYLFAVWVKVLDNSGAVYLGTLSNTVRKLNDGLQEDNPYFFFATKRHLPKNRWLLMVGYVFNKDYTGTNKYYKAGIYDPLTKERLNTEGTGDIRDFKWHESATYTYLRTFQYDCQIDNATVQFYGAGIWECNGTEPSIEQMLSAASKSIVPSRPSDTNLQAYYTFDRKATQDDSYNGRTLTESNGVVPLVTSPVKGKCAYFDGSKYLYRTDAAFKTNDFSVSLWFNCLGIASGQTNSGIFTLAYYLRLYIDSNKRLNCSGYDTSAKTVQRYIEWNKWYHLVFVYKIGGYYEVYINGMLVGKESFNFIYHSNEVMAIGCDYNNPSAYRFYGYIDEVRVYKSILTEAEILWLYLNAKQELDYGTLKTVIDGGLVSSGTVQVGQGNDGDYTVKAGMTGQGTEDNSVRFWAGSTYTDRNNAPFKVLQNGSMYATAGSIAGWDILQEAFRRVDGLNEIEINPITKTISFKYDGDDKVSIFNDVLPSLSSLVSPVSNTFETGIYKQMLFSDYVEIGQDTYLASGSILTSNAFTVPNSGIKTRTVIYMQERLNSFSGSLWLTDTSGNKLLSLGVANLYGFPDTPRTVYWDTSQKPVNAGTYKLLLEYEVMATAYEYNCIIGYGATSNNYLSYTQQKNGTMIGRDGLASFWSSTKYLYVNTNDPNYFFNLNGASKLMYSSNNGLDINANGSFLKKAQIVNQYAEQSFSGSGIITYSQTKIINFSAGSSYAVLPSLSAIRSLLNLSTSDSFSLLLYINAKSGSLTFTVCGRQTSPAIANSTDIPLLYDNNGNSGATFQLGSGDAAIIQLIYTGSSYQAYILSIRQ